MVRRQKAYDQKLCVESPESFVNFRLSHDPQRAIDDARVHEFRHFVWSYYCSYGRAFAWREHISPYRVVVSEIMLQQTQTQRVIPKFDAFVARFPDFATLAAASQKEVLTYWQGLGYNRRGCGLHATAQRITTEYGGELPCDPVVLQRFPSIGPATAASICAFAHNMPTVFIETNVRAVFLHVFFAGRRDVSDRDIMPLVAATLDRDNPREWYYALMDYGVLLKQYLDNPSRRSKHHTRQSRFEGSRRQVRGAIVRVLTQHDALSREEIVHATGHEHDRVCSVLEDLVQEQLVCRNGEQFSL